MYQWVADFLNGEFIISQKFDEIEECILHAMLNRKYILISNGRALDDFYVFYVQDGEGIVVSHNENMFTLLQLNDEY